jgi:predicted nucleic acid-binding protein
MKVFFDTSVLVAASVGSHPHHAQALPALRRVASQSGCATRPTRTVGLQRWGNYFKASAC